MNVRATLLALLTATMGGPRFVAAAAPTFAAGTEAGPPNVRETAAPIPLRATSGGTLTFPGGNLALTAFFTGWSSVPISADWAAAEEDAALFAVNAGRPVALRGRDGKTAFRGRSSWTAGPDGTVLGRIRLECVAPVTLQCVALCASIPAEPAAGLGDGVSATYDIPIDGGHSLRLAFNEPQPWHAQDSRPWGGRWSVRFGDTMRARDFSPGDVVEWNVTVSSPDGEPLAFSLGQPVTISEGDAWARLDYKKDIAAGSALDFSGLGLQDAPAGKHGWLKAVGGHFEFEGLPGVEQRFYGINLCFQAQYLTHEDADMVVERFVRFGYNAVRIHHHDGTWAAAYEGRRKEEKGRSAEGTGGSGAEPPFFVDDDIDRLDYLLAKCFEHGIYATTDLYVSRDIKWRDVGIDRDGDMPKALYKTYVGLHEPSFRDWAEHARAFLEHVNSYTGRAYKDEPAMPLISLVNEGRLATGWGECKKAEDPIIRDAWREFGGSGTPPDPDLNSPDSVFNRFDACVNRRIFEKGSAFLREMGCKSLLTDDNSGRWHGEGEGCTALYDYVDSHFYIDHPAFIDQLWRLPARCENVNPIITGKPPIFHRGYAKNASRPYVISEWNFSGPGRYRGMGGLLTGALAAEQDWDGLWRFTYSHESRNLKDLPVTTPGFFDSVTDPLVSASERAGVCLFLRRDASGNALALNREQGSMTIVSPHTCGGFTESGRIDAGPLSFEILGGPPFVAAATVAARTEPGPPVPTTLWVSSLDGSPIERSSRMLLVHLTDIQGDGTRYADESRQVLLKWGKGCLVENGEAEVKLRLTPLSREAALNAANGGDLSGEAALKGEGGLAVFALDTAGNRVGEVLSRMEEGVLSFRISTRGPDGKGCIYYEIIR